MVISKDNPESINFFQNLLLRNWLSKIENAFQVFNKSSSICLAAIENNEFLGYILVQPNNKRGTCWSISLPRILKEPSFNTIKELKISLLKASLNINSNKYKNWIMKFSSNKNDDIAIAREFGFQPQKLITVWSVVSEEQSINLIPSKQESSSFKWEKVNNENAYLLWKLERASESIHFREIIDRHPSDLFNNGEIYNSVLISREGKSPIAIAGLIAEFFPAYELTFQITRDILWDPRLTDQLSEILKPLFFKWNKILFETNEKDNKLNELLFKMGLQQNDIKILLSKSNFIRNEKKVKKSTPIEVESIFGNLPPANKPIPSPTLRLY